MNLVELAETLGGSLHVSGTLAGPHPANSCWNAKLWDVYAQDGEELYGAGWTMDEALLCIVDQARGKTLYRTRKGTRTDNFTLADGFTVPGDLILR